MRPFVACQCCAESNQVEAASLDECQQTNALIETIPAGLSPTRI
jgi:hypothetical protein